MQRATTPSQSGFTLLELIIAVSILAIVAVLSWRGLDAVLHTRDSLNESQARSDALQRSFNRLERDALLAQTVELFDGGRVRFGAANDTAVEYQLAGTTLTRRVLSLDGTVQEQQELFDQLTALRAEIYQRAADGSGLWTTTPNAGQNAGAGQGMMTAQPVGAPVAVQDPAQNSTQNPAMPVARFAAPPAPASPANPALPATSVADPVNAPNRPNTGTALPNSPGRSNPAALTGLRLRLTLPQGGVIERIVLLGASS